jgi:inward rectifier potassium channel
MKQRPPPPKGVTPIVQRGGVAGLQVVGLRKGWRGDLYHRAISLPWWGFVLVGASAYLLGNVIFAALYLLQPGAITQARPGSFSDAFFFSVQTMATIGYGAMSPATFYANVVVTAETLCGMLMLALVSGITFARVSIPTARVLFSRNAVITPYDGVPTLMLRMANQRRSQIAQAQVTISVLRNERNAEGVWMRRFHDLRLARSRTPVFGMTFTAMHPIEPDSPLWGATPDTLLRDEVEIVVAVTGLESTTGQTIHARTSYLASEVLFGQRFTDIFEQRPDGARVMDFRRFNDTQPS